MPDEKGHDKIVDYISKKYYNGGEHEKIREKILSDKKSFDWALSEVHKDDYHDKSVGEFKQSYYDRYGNPFPEKKNTSPNPEPLSETGGKESSTSGGKKTSSIDPSSLPTFETDPVKMEIESFQKEKGPKPIQTPAGEIKPDLVKGYEATKAEEIQKEQKKKEREEYLKTLDNKINPVSSALGTFDKQAINFPATVMEALAAGGTAIQRNIIAPVTGEEKSTIENDVLYQTAQGYRKLIDDMIPDNPAYQDDLTTKVAQSAGDLLTLVSTGGGSRATVLKDLANFSTKANLLKTTAKEASNILLSPPAITGAIQTGVAEYKAAKDAGADDDTAFKQFIVNGAAGNVLEAIPVMHFFSRLDKVSGGGVKEAIKNGATQGVDEMVTEVAQQAFSNITAKEAYDKTRKWYDGLAESGGIGFGLGFVLGGVGTNLRRLKEEAKTPEEKVEVQKAIDFIDQKSEELKANTEAQQTEPTQQADPGVAQEIQTNLETGKYHEANEEQNNQLGTGESNPVSPEAGTESGISQTIPEESIGEGVGQPVNPQRQSILEIDTDLTGQSKEIWMEPLSTQIPDPIAKEEEVHQAIIGGQFQEAIDAGRMTANDAKTIIESYGQSVPQVIQEQVINESYDNKEQQFTPEAGSEPTGNEPVPTAETQDQDNIQQPPGSGQADLGLPEPKIRKVAQRVLDSEVVDQEQKDNFKTKDIYYQPITNEQTDKDAADYINTQGPDKAYEEILKPKSGLQDVERGAIARNLFEHYSNLRANESDPVKKQELIEKASEAAAQAANFYTRAGQTVQSAKMWKRMLQKTPEGFLVEAERTLRDQRKPILEGFTKDLKENKKVLEEFITENIDLILDNPEVKKRIDAIAKTSKPLTKAQRKKKISDFFDNLIIKDDKGQAYEATYLVGKAVWNGAVKAMKKAALLGYDISEVIKSGVDYINSNNEGQPWDSESFQQEMPDRLKDVVIPREDVEVSDAMIRRGLEPDKIREIIKKHYTERSQIKTTLQEKLISQLGLEGDKAAGIAQDIEKRFNELIDKNQKKVLDRIAATKGFNADKRKIFFDKLKEEINLGAFDDSRFTEAYAKAMGVPEFTAQQKQKILDLSEKVQKAENYRDEYKKNRTQENRKKYEQLQQESEQAWSELSDMLGKDINIWDRLGVMMQGNLLSPISLITNVYSNIAFQPIRFLTKGVATGMDYLGAQIARGLGKKYDRTIRMSPGTQKAYFKGVAEGIKTGASQLVNGVPAGDMANREISKGFQPIRDWAKVKDAIKNKEYTKETLDNFAKALFGTPADVMFRLLNFGDKPFSTATYRAKLQEIGELKGLKGKELEEFVELPDEAGQQEGENAAKRATFQQDEPGSRKVITDFIIKILNSIGDMPLIGGPAKLIAKSQLPYVKTPLNIIAETLDYAVPLWSISRGAYEINNGNRQDGLMSISRGIVGLMIMAVVKELAKQGIVSPNPQDEQKERGIQYEYNPPNGINITALNRLMTGGNTNTPTEDIWVDYRRLGPLGIAMQSLIDYDFKKSPEEREAESYFKDLGSSLPSILSASMEQSFLQGTSTLLDAIKDGGSKLDDWLIKTTNAVSSSVVPNTIANLSRAVNDSQPNIKGSDFNESFINNLKARYFQGDDLPKKINIWGKEIPTAPEGRNKYLYTFIDPTKFRTLNRDDWGYKIYEDWVSSRERDLLPSIPSKRITINKKDYTLTPKEHEELLKEVGKKRAYFAQVVVENPGYEKLTIEQKAKKLKNAYDKGKKAGENIIKRKLKKKK